jgi:hypothetical protein
VINAFRPQPVTDTYACSEMAYRMLEKFNEQSHIQMRLSRAAKERSDLKNMIRKCVFSRAFSRRCSQSFFRYENNSNFHIINDFVVGSYQVKQAISYTQEQLSPSPHYEDELEFIVELFSHDDDLVRRHFSSRHSNNKIL